MRLLSADVIFVLGLQLEEEEEKRKECKKKRTEEAGCDFEFVLVKVFQSHVLALVLRFSFEGKGERTVNSGCSKKLNRWKIVAAAIVRVHGTVTPRRSSR